MGCDAETQSFKRHVYQLDGCDHLVRYQWGDDPVHYRWIHPNVILAGV